jgi:hypothetical protein
MPEATRIRSLSCAVPTTKNMNASPVVAVLARDRGGRVVGWLRVWWSLPRRHDDEQPAIDASDESQLADL